MAAGSLEHVVTRLVPSLSKSLAEQFNVFRVMHHGTHEKQLSNVFAWLLRPEATHGLGPLFQKIFIEQLALDRPELDALPTCGYKVTQEVDTSGHAEHGRDVADIVLTQAGTTILIENFESSDGHGHSFERYRSHGASEGHESVVVLLCARREPHRQTGGWEEAAVVTYSALLESLKAQVDQNATWRRTHDHQHSFINQLVEHFVEGAGPVTIEDQIAFIRTMCDTGESARYGHRPQEVAAQEFANLLAQHAKRQFDEGRATLLRIKRTLKAYAAGPLSEQLRLSLPDGHDVSVQARFVGQWEWCVTLRRTEAAPTIYLEFGPTAVVENGRTPEPIAHPDFSKVFVSRQAIDHDGIDRLFQTDVGLDEVLAGFENNDTRLRDAVLALVDES